MPFPVYSPSEQFSLLDRVAASLTNMLDTDDAVDIVEFAESKDYLNLKLYPRQRLILKLYYSLPFTPEELADVKGLLSCKNKYARLYFPGLCEHHITGHCQKKSCLDIFPKDDYRVLTDDEIISRLSGHYAHQLLVIAGRRGSKSMLGAVINAYELYRLVRSPSPQAYWHLPPGQEIGTANVATDERQALILFNQLKGALEDSPWFRRTRYRSLESRIEFVGRKIYAQSLHSNSSSVRGNTLLAIFIDEFCFFNQTAGKLSDKAMMQALAPSILTFKNSARIVMTSSPINKSGEAWEIFRSAEDRTGPFQFTIAFQLATWEMNPTVTQEDNEIAKTYLHDEAAAEMEFGAQWAEQVGQYIPPESIEACIPKDEKHRDSRSGLTMGQKNIKYNLHVDMSKKRDRCGLTIVHFDKDKGKVILDLAEEFDPTDDSSEWTDPITHEISHEKVFEYILNLTKLKGFRFQSITFDQFNSQWLVQALRKHYGDYEGKWIDEININDKSNREMFSNLRSLIVQGGIELYRYTPLIRQLVGLSRSIKPSGAFKIEAPPGQHDDIADSLAASAWSCITLSLGIVSGITGVLGTKEKEKEKSNHHKDCKPGTYCVYNCPVQSALRGGNSTP